VAKALKHRCRSKVKMFIRGGIPKGCILSWGESCHLCLFFTLHATGLLWKKLGLVENKGWQVGCVLFLAGRAHRQTAVEVSNSSSALTYRPVRLSCKPPLSWPMGCSNHFGVIRNIPE